MTMELLQYFHTICEYGSFFDAALECNLTQSALSKQISKLEHELGILLFDRSHRKITLTKAGSQFLEDSRIILEKYHNMLHHIEDIKEEESKTLRIAMLPIFYQYNLADIFHEFSKRHPDIQILLDEIEEFDIQDKCLSNAYDIYILRGDYHMNHRFQKMTLFEDTLAAVVSLQNPLSQQDCLSVAQLEEEALLLMPKHTVISQLAIHSCIEAGFHPHILRQGRIESILPLAKTNQGIALVMKKPLSFFKLNDVHVLSFKENIHANIYMYYIHHEQKESMQRFLSYMKHQI